MGNGDKSSKVKSKTVKQGSGSPKDVETEAKYTVTYMFKGDNGVALPVAVAVDGKVLTKYAKRAKRYQMNGKTKISVSVSDKAKVSLYLNSDTHPSYRKHPVYEVTVDNCDVLVTIERKSGKHSDTATPTRSNAKDPKASIHEYEAAITGDIWMKVSHKYAASEVTAALLPKGTSAEVTAAVKRVYGPLKSKVMTIEFPALPAPTPPTTPPVDSSLAGKPATTAADGAAASEEPAPTKLEVTFQNANNPKNNINDFKLLEDGLTRVHPAAYAALFTAARSAGATKLQISSNWRPLLGSIVHRSGRGIDVVKIDDVPMNRQELRGVGPDTTNVSAKEKQYYDAWKATEKTLETLTEAEAKATKTLADAAAALAKQQTSYDAVKANAQKEPAAKLELDAATSTQADAKKAVDEAAKAKAKATTKIDETKKAWNEECNANQPKVVERFRESLLKSSRVSQVMDPWIMETRMYDKLPPAPNVQVTKNERRHSHHLHLTVHDYKLG